MSLRRLVAAAFPMLVEFKVAAGLFIRHRPPVLRCVCCGAETKFRIFGLPPRLNAECPRCRSKERHRLQRVYLDEHPELVDGKDILHFAPEPFMRGFLGSRANRYVGCDLHPEAGDVRINIEQIDFPDRSFDLIICSHVLEHVDDKRALTELHRVLRPGGTLCLMFPIIEGWVETYEDAKIVTRAGRLRHFGQEDHIRYFGADVRSRIQKAGFGLTEFTACEPLVSRYGLLRGEKVFVARRDPSSRRD